MSIESSMFPKRLKFAVSTTLFCRLWTLCLGSHLCLFLYQVQIVFISMPLKTLLMSGKIKQKQQKPRWPL